MRQRAVAFLVYAGFFRQLLVAEPAAFYRIVSTNNAQIVSLRRDGVLIWSNATATGLFQVEATGALGGSNLWKTVGCGTKTGRVANVSLALGPWNDQFQQRSNFLLGGVVCDYFAKRTWDRFWPQNHPLQILKTNGFDWVRVGVLTTSSATLAANPPSTWRSFPWQSEFWSSLEYAREILREASERGLRLNLFFFLSHQPAHAGQQNAPPEWSGLSVAETANALQTYTFKTTKYFQDQGLNIEIYDIGNEIEMGILNFRPGDRIDRPPTVDVTTDMNYMKSNVWNIEATLLKGAIAGVKQANPAAKITLHIAGLGISPDDIFVKTFFQAMVEQAVPFDYAGLSHPYPSPGWGLGDYPAGCWLQRLAETIAFISSLNKKVIISEAAYPNNSAGIAGNPMQDYPYAPAGQASWVRDQLRFYSHNANVAGFFYFYPEYFPGLSSDAGTLNLQSSGLFETDTALMPAMGEFRVNLAP